MLLRALAALTPIPICWLWLEHYFTFLVNNLCGDCSPPQPIIPDVFGFGNSVLVGAAILGPILFLVFLAFAMFSFARGGRKPENPLTN